MLYNTLIPLIKSFYPIKINAFNIDIEKGNNSIHNMNSILKSVVIYNEELKEIIIQQ